MSKLIFSPTKTTDIKVGERYALHTSEVDEYNENGDEPSILTVDEYYPIEDAGFIVQGTVSTDDEEPYKYSELLDSEEILYLVEVADQ